MADKRAIKVETLDRLGASFQESRGITDKLTIEEMIELAKVPIASGDNKLAQLTDNTITEITAEDLEGATQIREYAFYLMDKLEVIEFPNTITKIGDYAFGCNSLQRNKITTLVFPNSITSLGKQMCQYSNNLQSVILPQNPQCVEIPNGAFEFCQYINNVVIPDNITKLGKNVFSYCERLLQLTLPASITVLGQYSLICGTTTNKATFTFLGTTPPTIAATTFSANKINKIIVPKGCGEAYKTATNWANFADFIEEASV
jgi:hypothetical protein